MAVGVSPGLLHFLTVTLFSRHFLPRLESFAFGDRHQSPDALFGHFHSSAVTKSIRVVRVEEHTVNIDSSKSCENRGAI